MSANQRRVCALLLWLVAVICAALAVLYALVKTRFPFGSNGYHHNRAIVLGIVALLVFGASFLLRPFARTVAN